ncbi:hypothetical protein E2C01_014147 [Portunus trituberculatus]|uniref:Uncharacterized protein n=1 Tax=Portunus trituberculatus TaxID=210409 RepID=A0A5B7DI15_PORTR|nr:hypothetical protein [Portunus trituberculatus]
MSSKAMVSVARRKGCVPKHVPTLTDRQWQKQPLSLVCAGPATKPHHACGGDERQTATVARIPVFVKAGTSADKSVAF